MKYIFILFASLSVLCRYSSVAAPVPGAQGPLHVGNGDFSDLTGLTEGQDGWPGGIPKAWRGSDGAYALHAKRGATPPTCYPSNLGFLRQNVGVLDKASGVTLRP